MNADRRFGLAMAATTALLWGFLAIALKVAVQRVDVVTIVWFRFTAAFVVLAVLVGSRDAQRLGILRRPPPLSLVAAVLLLANYLCFLAALDHTTPSNAQILIQLAPLLLAASGVMFFGETLNRAQLLGVGVATVGFALFYRDQLAQLVGASDRYVTGNLILLAAAVSWALYAVLQKLLSQRGHAPQDLNLVLYALPAVALAPFADFGVLAELTSGWWLLMFFLAFNTLVAYGALGEALKRLPAHEVSLVITCNPLITLAAMAVLASLSVTWIEPDRIGTLGWVAAGLVILGVGRALQKR